MLNMMHGYHEFLHLAPLVSHDVLADGTVRMVFKHGGKCLASFNMPFALAMLRDKSYVAKGLASLMLQSCRALANWDMVRASDTSGRSQRQRGPCTTYVEGLHSAWGGITPG